MSHPSPEFPISRSHQASESPHRVTGCTALFTTCGDRAEPELIELISPVSPTRLLTEGWIPHPDGDLPLFAPPGGDEFFKLIDAAIQRAPGVFMQRYLSVDDLLAELTQNELVDLAGWLLHVLDAGNGNDSLLVRWATDLQVQVNVWLVYRQWQADELAQRHAASERA